MNYDCELIANRIRFLARQQNIRLGVMLSALSLSVNRIAELAEGHAISSISLAQIADYLNCSVDYLLGRTLEPYIDKSGHKHMFDTISTAERIKAIAKIRQIPVKTVLEECELNKNVLSTMLSRGSMPKADNIGRIAEYLDCSVDYLLGLTDNPNKNSSSPERDELLKDPRVLDLINALLSIPPDQRDRFLEELDTQLQLLTNPKDIK